MNILFFINNILLGVGLAMDAFSVSLANGLNEPKMKIKKMTFVASNFSFFQSIMTILGWFCVHSILVYFTAFQKFIPYIALTLLTIIGTKMILDSSNQNENTKNVGILTLIIQGIATSIDALSVGFTIVEYSVLMAIISALIIGIVTFIICFSGILIGKKFGTYLSNKASIFGGIILIFIGLEIFILGIF